MWTLHTDSGNSLYGGQYAKNIYLGDTRIVTKLNSGKDPTYQEESQKQYYYHSDHLGSASLISDYNGKEYQRIEYTPYGETWVEKTCNTGNEFLPYKFTGKEIDEETGLYYYGARYLDPKYSLWISADPALGDYIPGVGKATANDIGNLPGMGGAFNHINFNLYHYAGNNPVKYVDPDGKSDDPYSVTGRYMGEPQCPSINILVKLSENKNSNYALVGTLTVYYADYKESKLGLMGKKVLTVPVVSGGKDFAPAPEGVYLDQKQEKTNTSSNPLLKDSNHGGPDNLMIRLLGTGGDAIHQGNSEATIDTAYTEGCISITANSYFYDNETGMTDVEKNYQAFKDALNPYYYGEVNVNVYVSYE